MPDNRLTESFLYPPLEPYAAELLAVGDGHRIYYEECGLASGMPVVFLHGGPGSGCSARHRQLFDPALCRVILLDQRGCGRSLPRGELQGNSTDRLVADIEQLRLHLGIGRWLVFGGSWGAGLALAYAVEHPESCLALVLRGVFLGRPSDLDWFFQYAGQLLPDAWDALAANAPAAARADLLRWLAAGVLGDEPQQALLCAVAWEAWEAALSQRQMVAPRFSPPAADAAAALLQKYRLQSHYLLNACFWNGAELLQRTQGLGTIPAAILHGRLDWICQPQAAWDLHHSLPGSRLQWLDDCGHSPFDPAMTKALAQAVRHFSRDGNFARWGRDYTRPPCA